jgi:hypothetical protein
VSINFAAIPAQSYIGTPFSYPIQLGRASGRCVPISINWLPYYAFNQSINQAINVGLFGGSVQLLDQVRSVYIDNLNSNVPIYIQCVDTGFTVTAAPNTAGFYPLMTNSYEFVIVAIGLIPTELPLTSIYFTNIYVPAYTDAAFVASIDYALASPLISFGGSGGEIDDLQIILTGSCYSGGSISITGGGGSGATAHGELDIYGRFISIILDSPGENYTGFPNIVANSPQNSINAWANISYGSGSLVTFDGEIFSNPGALVASGTYPTWIAGTTYLAGQIVQYNGIAYEALQNNLNTPPPHAGFWGQVAVINQSPAAAPSLWNSTGVPVNQTAEFICSLIPPVGAISLQASSAYGARALGDQVLNYQDIVTGTGTFRSNLFGTPYASGFIYLTDIYVFVFNGENNVWSIEDVEGNAFLTFNGSTSSVPLYAMHNGNVKIPANVEWILSCSFFDAAQTTNHGFSYTYSPF